MEENIVTINSVDPVSLQPILTSETDLDNISEVVVDNTFDPNSDYIELVVYDFNKVQSLPGLGTNNIVDFTNYGVDVTTNIGNNIYYDSITLNPSEDAKSFGFTKGTFYVLYNFYKKILGSSPLDQYFISEISSDRTEIRIKSNDISSNLLIETTNNFISFFTSTSYYPEFYLNFGGNRILPAINIRLDSTDITNPSILIKLYEPLPNNITLKSKLWAVEKISDPSSFKVEYPVIPIEIPRGISLSGPNFNLEIQDQINNSTNYTTYQSLTSNYLTSSFNQLSSLLQEKGMDINIDYTNFNDFVKFSSAVYRLENFAYKVGQLDTYNLQIVSQSLVPTGGTYNSESISTLQGYIKDIINNFDRYEYYLYFESGSKTWPKQNSTIPYNLYPLTSSQALTWLGSSDPSSLYFGGQIYSGSNYDNQNADNLLYSVPEYLRNDEANEPYELFVSMVGQYFDNIWLYTKDLTNKFDGDNRINYGISKDLVTDAIKDFGLKIYQNSFSSDDLFTSFLGITPSGSIAPFPGTTNLLPTPEGFDYITQYISGSSEVVPLDDLTKRIYKRIYHNLPYLLKKKGTVEGLRSLINIFGIPDTILRINEFGGKDKNSNTWDYWQNTFNYALKSTGSYYVSSSFSLNSTWVAPNNVPGAVEFRFKPQSIPPTNKSQSLWLTDKGLGIFLEYTGSGLTTASYSASVVNPYYQYGTLKFTSGTNSASVYLPFFNGDWWSILINSSSGNYTLYAKNSIYSGDDGNTIGFQASSSLNVSTLWSASTVSYFASSSGTYVGLSGSLQEIRYYTLPISESTFNAYVMNPNSIEQSQYLAFRAALGGELYTGSTSIHPKITGSWTPTSSFTSTSNFYISATPTYSTNTEVYFYDQPAVGIQNAVSNKIKIVDNILPPTSSNLIPSQSLSPYISIQQNFKISESYTEDVNYVEVAYSPQNEINEDIMSTLGFFNIGEYIGDPRQASQSLNNYPDLNILRDNYFEKYKHNYNVQDFVRLIKFFDNSLFKMIKDFVPARTDVATGVVIKQHILERNKYTLPNPTSDTTLAYYSGSSYNTPLTFTNLVFSGSIDGNLTIITASNAGVMPQLNGLTSSIGLYSPITQSWTGFTPSTGGLVPFTQSTQDEFINGELSGSNILVTNGELGDCNVEIVSVYTTSSLYTGINPNATTGYNFNKYNLNYEKTYYVSFTASEVNGISAGVLQLWNQGSGTNILYTSPSIPAGGTLVVDKLELSKIILPITFKAVGASSVGLTITNFTIYESYIDYDCLVVQNNAIDNRLSSVYMDVDYSSNSIIPLNKTLILSGSATKFAIPDSNYTTKRITNPRYDGSRTTSPDVNKAIYKNPSYSFVNGSITSSLPSTQSQVPNIEYYSNYFVYFDWIGGSNPQYTGGGNIHCIYLIGIDGIAYPLTTDNLNLGRIENIFVKGQTANILPAVYSAGNPPTKVEIVEGGALYETILFKSGSDTPRYQVKWVNDPVAIIKTPTFFTGSTPYSILNDNTQNWLYPFLTGSDVQSGSVEYIRPRKVTTQTLFFYNKKKGSFPLTTDNDQGITKLEDTYFPIQYGDFIRFGTTGSIVDDSGSLDGSFAGLDLVTIKDIVIAATASQTSSLLITPSLTSGSVLLGNDNNQNFRIMRRIPNESFVLVKNNPSYGDPGFLIPNNFNPNYDVYELARKAGVIQ